MTKILLVDNGITFDSKLIREKPFGGAEVAFVSLGESIAKEKFEVVVYNNCKNSGLINGVNWKKLDTNIEKEKCDVFIQTTGGGLTGQADAIRLGCARALCLMDQTYRAELKANGFLTRNSLKKERKKYGLKKARKAPQFSKR